MALIKPASENAIQAAYFQWTAYASNKYPELQLAFAIPNGVNKTPAQRIVFKATGLKSGVPDVFLPVARGGWHGLFIEFKTEKGRLSDTQQTWLDQLADQGYKTLLCRDWSDAAEKTIEYLEDETIEATVIQNDLIWFDLGADPPK